MKRNRQRLTARDLRAVAAINDTLPCAVSFRRFDGVSKRTAAQFDAMSWRYRINQTGIARMRAALKG